MQNSLLKRVSNLEFGGFYEKYFTAVYKYVYREIQDQQIAEDIVQETFYTAYRKWEEVETHPSQQGWLFRTSRYKMQELNRRMNRQVEVSLEEAPPDPGSEEEDYDLQELELAALVTLESNEWNLVKKHYLWGYTIHDLARIEGMTENNLRVRMSRIIKKLRVAWSK